jgi:hypothetical protein
MWYYGMMSVGEVAGWGGAEGQMMCLGEHDVTGPASESVLVLQQRKKGAQCDVSR